jgi:hypothetical protein
VKSDVLIVPETVFRDQYKVVASGTLAVVTVNVTLEPSFTEAVDGDTEYDTYGDDSLCCINTSYNKALVGGRLTVDQVFSYVLDI